MTTAQSDPTTDQTPKTLWRFIPLSQFEKERPQEPTQEVVRHGLRAIWQQFSRNRSAQAETETPEEARSLKSAPQRMMDMAVPQAEWGKMGGAGLDEALSGWLEQGSGRQAIVGGPASGVDEMVRAWGRDQGLSILTPPSPEALLSGEDWLGQQLTIEEGNRPRLILPGLERCFLRHPDGLDGVRRLLDLIWTEQIACVLTCDSWAWAYLNRVLHIEAVLPAPLTLAPLDATALTLWFRELAERNEPRNLTFRQATNGRPVLPSTTSAGHEAEDKTAKTDREFLIHLAARSRGNPGVARAIWRESLQVNSAEEVESKAQEEAAADRGYTMWVNPWTKLSLPSLPSNADREDALVLYTLLLHNGLSTEHLSDLLPLGQARVVQIIQHLRAARLVTNEADRWIITPLGYPAVRVFLGREGFLADVL